MYTVETAAPHPLNTIAWVHDMPGDTPDALFDIGAPILLRPEHIQAKIRAAAGSRAIAVACARYGAQGIITHDWVPAGTSDATPYPAGWSSVHISPRATAHLADIIAEVIAKMQPHINEPRVVYTPSDTEPLPAGRLWVPEPIREHFSAT